MPKSAVLGAAWAACKITAAAEDVLAQTRAHATNLDVLERPARRRRPMRAEMQGRRLARWSWCATVAGIRILFVATVLAIVRHAIVLGMPVGAIWSSLTVANLISAPIKPILHAMRARCGCK